MAFSNLDLGLDWDSNPVFATDSGNAEVQRNNIFGNLTDRIFGFGTDALSSYLDLKKQELLIDEQTRLLLAKQQQNSLLNTIEVPNQINANTLQPWQIASLSGTGSAGTGLSNQTLIIAAAALAAFMIVK